MNGILWALGGTLFTFSVTALGALNVFLVRREVSGALQCAFLGFAGGVMTAASIWSLLIPGIEQAEVNGQISWLVAAGGFLLGVLLLLGIDRLLKRFLGQEEAENSAGSDRHYRKSTWMMVLAITIHNIPEGMAVGLAFALAAQNAGDAGLLSGALILALGIGIQNYPEGTAVALPLIRDGMGRRKAFVLGSLSAVVEPVFGVLAAALAGRVMSYLPLLLAFAAGTMIYVVVEELIPEAHPGEQENIGTLGFIVGFLLMMILDVALG
ncbi:MAG: ZIP family metal transporter [Lachnospiraceae bacterium]|nr:ZIP family metal transporter [Lachnospiraceae bacterium]